MRSASQTRARATALDGDSLRAWQARMGYTQQQAAHALGVSWATYKRYLTTGAGRTVALACAALEARLTPLQDHRRPGCIVSQCASTAAAAAPHAPPEADAAGRMASQESPKRLATGDYRCRRPRSGDPAEQSHDWIAEFQGGLRVGLGRRPAHEYHRWRGRIIDNSSMFPRDAAGGTRQEVMNTIISLYLFDQLPTRGG